MNATTETPKLTPAQIRKRVKDRERRFKAMSPERKRMAIARDVLDQLAAQKLVARAGQWITSEALPTYSDDLEMDLQMSLARGGECTGCAMGGLFVCAVQRANELKYGDLVYEGDRVYDGDVQAGYASFGWYKLTEYLKRFFTEDQLEMIECAFERGLGHVRGRELYSAVSFGDKYDDDGDRMAAIMKNIIANKGEFRP